MIFKGISTMYGPMTIQAGAAKESIARTTAGKA